MYNSRLYTSSFTTCCGLHQKTSFVSIRPHSSAHSGDTSKQRPTLPSWPSIQSFTWQGLETSSWSSSRALYGPTPQRHWICSCQPLRTGHSAGPWWSDATALAGYATTTTTTQGESFCIAYAPAPILGHRGRYLSVELGFTPSRNGWPSYWIQQTAILDRSYLTVKTFFLFFIRYPRCLWPLTPQQKSDKLNTARTDTIAVHVN